jgi:outer membrane receptor protein involved in Fe transport
LRWTEDQKHFPRIPSWLLVSNSWGLPVLGVVDQQWDQFSGRANVTWTPKLYFTDQTLVYGSYAHGYKAGGANPPGALLLAGFEPTHPLIFKPEFVDAFELGSKNTLLDGALTINASTFYYNYENYQISEIVDRTSINLNFDAHVHGAELETTWEPVPGLRFNFAGGYEATSLAAGSKAVDLMDRTGGDPNWVVIKPYPTAASNCVVPIYVAVSVLPDLICQSYRLNRHVGDTTASLWDPVTQLPYKPYPTESAGTVIPPGYPGFDPSTAPNGGAGFDKDLGGNELPNAPPLTVSAGAQYTIPLNSDWAATLRGDYYWQDYSWARVFNDAPYDRLRGYTNVNLTVILTSQFGWQVMLYDKNIFNTTAITGTFLNSDDTGLTTNVFLTDPKLIGIRITKNW